MLQSGDSNQLIVNPSMRPFVRAGLCNVHVVAALVGGFIAFAGLSRLGAAAPWDAIGGVAVAVLIGQHYLRCVCRIMFGETSLMIVMPVSEREVGYADIVHAAVDAKSLWQSLDLDLVLRNKQRVSGWCIASDTNWGSLESTRARLLEVLRARGVNIMGPLIIP